MAKPSVTNIRPPSQTGNWEPAKTAWNLDTELDGTWLATQDTNHAQYDALFGQVNLNLTGWTSEEIAIAKSGYDYIFLGVNGGYDETVTGKHDAGGIIVTGNGKDNITGGSRGDFVMSGNGVDIVHGGGGDDIVYGENGSDQLYGDANNDFIDGGNGGDLIVGGTDDGPAPWVFVPGASETITTSVLNEVDWLNPAPADWSVDAGSGAFKRDGTYQDNSGELHKEGAYLDGNGDIHQVFSFDSKDLPAVDVLDSHTFTVAVYGDGLAQAQLIGKVGAFTALENQKTTFSVDLGHLGAETVFSNGNHVAVFLGDLSEAQLQAISDPQQASLKAQGLDGLMSFYHLETTTVETPGHWEFQWAGAGDVLVGGADADTFVYAAGDGVDEITDYHRAELDVLKLVGIEHDSVEIISDGTDSYVTFADAADPSGHVQDAAIRIVGVSDFTVNEIVFA
jgi:Ca2+-binding RTX toxin-like protein